VSVRRSVPESGQLFSDLNQRMLKVLLAPELPEGLLSAPRGQYRNASQLAAPHLDLVRREDLFGRWLALSAPAPQSVFRGAVRSGGVAACDTCRSGSTWRGTPCGDGSKQT
jgi:hypothetical protein